MAEKVEGHDELERTIICAAKQLGYSSIKELQLEVIKKIITGHDVLAVLPTGFGNSLCYRCFPLVFDEIYKPEQATIICVISLLVGIIEDQVCIHSRIKLRRINEFCQQVLYFFTLYNTGALICNQRLINWMCIK